MSRKRPCCGAFTEQSSIIRARLVSSTIDGSRTGARARPDVTQGFGKTRFALCSGVNEYGAGPGHVPVRDLDPVRTWTLGRMGIAVPQLRVFGLTVGAAAQDGHAPGETIRRLCRSRRRHGSSTTTPPDPTGGPSWGGARTHAAVGVSPFQSSPAGKKAFMSLRKRARDHTLVALKRRYAAWPGSARLAGDAAQ